MENLSFEYKLYKAHRNEKNIIFLKRALRLKLPAGFLICNIISLIKSNFIMKWVRCSSGSQVFSKELKPFHLMRYFVPSTNRTTKMSPGVLV